MNCFEVRDLRADHHAAIKGPPSYRATIAAPDHGGNTDGD